VWKESAGRGIAAVWKKLARQGLAQEFFKARTRSFWARRHAEIMAKLGVGANGGATEEHIKAIKLDFPKIDVTECNRKAAEKETKSGKEYLRVGYFLWWVINEEDVRCEGVKKREDDHERARNNEIQDIQYAAANRPVSAERTKVLFEEMREIRKLTDAHPELVKYIEDHRETTLQEARAVVARIKTENYLTMRRPAEWARKSLLFAVLLTCNKSRYRPVRKASKASFFLFNCN
jgi:hypothetical protein